MLPRLPARASARARQTRVTRSANPSTRTPPPHPPHAAFRRDRAFMVPGASLIPSPRNRELRGTWNEYGMEISQADFTGPRCVRVPGIGPIGARRSALQFLGAE